MKVEVPKGKISGMEAKKFELDYRRVQEKKDDHQKDKCKSFAIVGEMIFIGLLRWHGAVSFVRRGY